MMDISSHEIGSHGVDLIGMYLDEIIHRRIAVHFRPSASHNKGMRSSSLKSLKKRVPQLGDCSGVLRLLDRINAAGLGNSCSHI